MKSLRINNPELLIIKSIIIGRQSKDHFIKFIQKYSPFVDYFITDTLDETTGACGATGKTHDWSKSRFIADHSSNPIILAGGLKSENIRDAIIQVRPFGVDSHSGVEDEFGNKNYDKILKFVQNAKTEFELQNYINSSD